MIDISRKSYYVTIFKLETGKCTEELNREVDHVFKGDRKLYKTMEKERTKYLF